METLDANKVIDTLGMGYLRELVAFNALEEKVIVDILQHGEILSLAKGEYLARFDELASDFQIVLSGNLAYYKHCGDHAVFTRHFAFGEQVGFDEMIGLINRNGTDVATEESLLLTISSEQFYDMHIKYPAEFGIFMLNLARELSREIEMLEDVIGEGTGWLSEQQLA